MINESKTINKYPTRDKFITNFTAIDWLKERIAYIKSLNDAKRLALYKGMVAKDLLIEEPTVFHRDEGYFRSTIVARKNGLCFPDPKIKFFTFPDFLEYIDPGKSFYNKGTIPKELTFNDLISIVEKTTEFPSADTYALTKIAASDKYALLVTGSNTVIDLDDIFDTLFKGYLFQTISGTALEVNDNDYPKSAKTTLDGYVVGTITLTDILLTEQTDTIDVFNIRLIKSIIGDVDIRYNGSYHYDGTITY